MKIRRKASRLRKKVAPTRGPRPLWVDPTRTATLRARFAAKLKAAFQRLKWEVRRLVLEEDALGLREVSHDPFKPVNFAIAVGDEPLSMFARNAFCPTGEGGGVDPTCSPGGSGRSLSLDESDALNTWKLNAWGKVKGSQREGTALGARFTSALKKLPAATGTSYRGIAVLKDDDRYEVGKEVRFVTSESFSSSEDFASGWVAEHPRISGSLAEGNREPVVLVAPPSGSMRVLGGPQDEVVNLPDVSAKVLRHEVRGGIKYVYLSHPSPRSPTGNARWSHRPDPEKIRLFQEWLRQKVKTHLTSQEQERFWQLYVEEGFRRGAGRAFDDANAKARAASGSQPSGFYQGTKAEFLRSSFANPVAVEKVKLLAGRSFDDLEGVTADMSVRMSRTLTDGLVQGKSPRDVARDLEAEVEVGKVRALTVSRTELIRAHSDGQLQALEDLGVEEVGVMVEWVVTPDEKLCPKCAALEGVVLKLEEARGLIPQHPNAVFAGSTFQPYGECLEFVRAHYDGPAVVLVADGGHGTTIGPNHPVLTRRGFVRAAEVKEGDEVLYDLRGQPPLAGIEPDLEEVPLVEDAFEACLAVQADSPVPPSGSDLHGDVVHCQGEIETVRPERGLLRVLDPLGVEKLCENDLPRPYPKADRMPSPGPGGLGRGGVLLPPAGGVGSPDPWVAADDGFVWLSVHSVSFGRFVGAAFDCTTTSGLYRSDGFVVKNCRCTWVPANVGESTRGQKRTKGEVEDAFEEADMDEEVSERRPQSLFNAFCPTGEGGGVDPTCSPGGGGRGPTPHVAKAARDVVSAGKANGREHMVVLDREGRQVGSHREASDTEGSVDFPSGVGLEREGADLRVHHNHPDNSSFSAQDLGAFHQRPGLAVLYAHTHDGTTHEARPVAGKERDLWKRSKELYEDSYERIKQAVIDKGPPYDRAKMDRDVIEAARKIPEQLQREGLLRYRSYPSQEPAANAWTPFAPAFDPTKIRHP